MPLGSLAQPRPGRVGVLVERLTPGYFALVMASGIISLGLQLVGFTVLSVVLFAVCITAYVVLIVLNVWRFAAFRHAMIDDFKNPKRAFGFFTFVAGTNVLGARAGAEGWYTLTAWLLVISFAVWLVLGYVIPWSAVLGRSERPVVALANGTWFIWVVASQSVAVSAATLEVVLVELRAWLAILAVFSWSVGVFLYVASAIIVALRIMLYELDPTEFDPPYWVSMGAVAITVVAGARIVEMESAPMADATQGLVAGLSVVFWAFATWLIPVLVAAGVWRHYVRKVPLVYVPTLWSMIFPLGMYAVAGIYLGRADRLPIVEAIGSNWLWVALTAWALVFVAMVRSVGAALLDRSRT
ncbi:tellurite resistance/C4-dicarboxylate transporter family protein [Intrasporangium sp.]|uniref:tellurite resistance/C4-dicarboxylate transporter family protein n=1 Tax=Intrasporangium sp. TaxID=1925024 RepID=UPI002939A74A|nr:tellurite resistance/C4-dicarboxylate transporter family protein [Intrasporangium sp.]MDV3223386.1 tellurite resistance/C4-dicarboxylate transporter family protein [Intrasporangium sp.]